MKKKILISTGGSGGHVVPALNLYNHLKNEFDVMLYTDLRGAKYVPEKIKNSVAASDAFFPFERCKVCSRRN